MLKSLNECTPQEMLALKASELKEAIRLSEGRVVTTLSRVRGPNYLQYVTNAEVCAAFGSDILYPVSYTHLAIRMEVCCFQSTKTDYVRRTFE